VREILRDIESLDGHTAFLFNKINFLMDATDSAININQNKDIKRLTVLSVIFMPINVAGRHGRHVRVLDDDRGYSLADRLFGHGRRYGGHRYPDLLRAAIFRAATDKQQSRAANRRTD
jgi:hypothetical protein